MNVLLKALSNWLGVTTNPPPPAPADPLDAVKKRAEIAKLNAETEKAAIESNDARRFFLFRHQFWTAATPGLLALAGLLYTWKTGFFNSLERQNKADRTFLEADGTRLRAERTLLTYEVARLDDERKDLQAERSVLLTQVFEWSNRVETLQGIISTNTAERDQMKVLLDSYASVVPLKTNALWLLSNYFGLSSNFPAVLSNATLSNLRLSKGDQVLKLLHAARLRSDQSAAQQEQELK